MNLIEKKVVLRLNREKIALNEGFNSFVLLKSIESAKESMCIF